MGVDSICITTQYYSKEAVTRPSIFTTKLNLNFGQYLALLTQDE